MNYDDELRQSPVAIGRDGDFAKLKVAKSGRTAETFVKHDRLPLYFAKSQVWPLFVERKNDIIQVFSLGVVVP